MGSGLSICGGDGGAARAPTTIAQAGKRPDASRQVSFIADEPETERSGNKVSFGATKSRNMSLRRTQSLYHDQDDDEGEVNEEIKETTMLRLGSVKNTGVFVNQYAIVKNLGSGSFGKVKLAMDTKTGELVAIKIVTRANKQRKQMMMRRMQSNMMLGEDPDEQFAREIAVMKQLRHINVVQLIEVIDDPNSSKLILVMEFVDGGVVDCGQPMKELQARKYFRDAGKGLRYLHRNNIIHGDIKPDNMMLSDEEGVVKLTDFGSSANFERGDTMVKTNGTPAFMCPEMCEAKPYHGRVADCWALGVCLWFMLFGRPPFEGGTIVALYEAIRDKELEFPQGVEVSDECKDLLLSILKKDPEERLDLDGILSHPWTTEQGELDLLADEGVDVYELADNARIEAYNEITELLSDFPTRNFKDGEYLFMAGHEASTMYFITNGQVDIVLREKDRADLVPTQEVRSDSDEDDDSESEDEEDDMPNEQEDGLVAPGESKTKPAWAVSKFSQSTYNVVKHVSGHLHQQMSMRGQEDGEDMLGTKSAGEFAGSIGAPGIREEDKLHTTTARAKGTVTAIVIDRDAADDLLDSDPENSTILRKAMSKKEVENQVHEVMARMSTLHRNIQKEEKRKTGTFTMADLPPELQ